jgi:drug/metabolite transporter (DMT)-like permease
VSSRRTLALFGVASVLFGGTFVAAKAGLDQFPPLLFVALRLDVAAVALLGYAVLTTSRSDLLPRTPGDVAGILATGIIAVGLTNALLFVGQAHVTSGVAAIVFSLNPILTPVFAGLVLADEHLTRREAVGLVVGLVGVGFVVSPDPTALLSGGVGRSILFAGAVSGALGSVLIRRAGGGLSSTVRTAWGLPAGALLGHVLSLAAGESPTAIRWGPDAVGALLYVGLFAGAIAYVAYFDLLDTVGAIRANLLFYVVPLVATVGGWALLGETVETAAIAGFLVVFVGFAIIGSETFALRAHLPARDQTGADTPGDEAFVEAD